MVKNTKGGNKHKGKASKYNKPTDNKNIRVSKSEYEIYAAVTEILGGGHCRVKCIDSIDRMAYISKKFKYERLEKGKLCLIGLREWQTNIASKVEKCDILEVYNQVETDTLVKINGYNWRILLNLDNTTSCDVSDDIIFSNKSSNVNENSMDISYKTSKIEETEIQEEINFDEI